MSTLPAARHARVRRSSLAAEVLPPVHFLFLNAQILIFVLCFLVRTTEAASPGVWSPGACDCACLTAACTPCCQT